MHEGLRQVHETIEEMIEQVANEPSVGLYYVQQHIHNAVPVLARIKAQVTDTTREVFICTQDMEDAINSVKSVKECGPPLVGQMIRKINSSISLMSSMHQVIRQRQQGNLQGRSSLMSKDNAVLSTLGSAFQTASRAAWRSHSPDVQPTGGHINEIDSANGQINYEGREELPITDAAGTSTSFVQSYFKSALQRAGTLGWSSSSITENATQKDAGVLTRNSCAELLQADVVHSPADYSTCAVLESVTSTAETVRSQHRDTMRAQIQKDKEEDENTLLPVSSPSVLQGDHSLEHSENFEQFQAECAAKLEAWLSESDEGSNTSGQEYDLKPVV